jgi:uncharacterized protein YjbI with pentapeptide repeats
MADKEHVKRLRQGIEEWNAWRQDKPTIRPILSRADLRGADLSDAYLIRAILSGANLSRADLNGADLSGADLFCADLSRAILSRANLRVAILSRAILSRADLNGAYLEGANLDGARLDETIFADIDLTSVIGLETCHHHGASIIDHRTLEKSKSKPLPLRFLRGVGLPDNLIEYLPSIFNQAIQHYSCFISYSAKDQDFADRLHAELQNKGVRLLVCTARSADRRRNT